ncbi:MAG: 23S rRNA pseudouridine synthase [Microgenomates group bacterium LiPW_16]|nr:MAG: 23S rRNA pseudouridine synthase [Microgenomates group bacterium LiPW_16]
MRKEKRKVSLSPKVLVEDENFLVVEKPAGMVVNKADTTEKEKTLQAWVEKKLGIRNWKLGIGGRAGIVHRLDKETSGLLVIAKTPEAFVNLQAQFKNRQVVKKYLALVHGRVVPEEGEIRAPVGRLPWNRERFGVVPGGREAVTKYKVVKYYTLTPNPISPKGASSAYTLIELSPLTGRTHQIRVHLKYLGYPIVGDQFYAGRKRARGDRKFCPRVFLHASFLEVSHPVTGKRLKFESPLPYDLNKVLRYIDI